MKCLFKVLTLVLMTLLLISSPVISQIDTLTILHVNDSHSNLSPLGPREPTLEGTQGSIARAATLIGQTMMQDPNVLLLHAGDVFIGDFFFNVFFGVAEFQMMLSLGFDAMAVGNHEFDLTPAVLQASLETAFTTGSFPLLSANLNLEDPGVSGLKDYISPYTIKEVGNVKVGIFGMTTPETNIFSQPYPAFIDTNIVQISAAMVDTLTAENCDVIICLSHLGFELDQLVASYVPGINAIVGGHTHTLLEEPVPIINPGGTTTWIVQVGAFYSYMGKLQLTINDGQVDLLDYQAIHLDSSIPEEPTIAGTVEFLTADIEALYGHVYSQQVSYAAEYFQEVAVDLLEEGPHDTPIGNFVTDAFIATTGTDIAIQPCGSTAQPLYQGPLVPADIFRVVGYGFNTDNGLGYRLATFDITAPDLLAGLEFGVSQIEVNDEFLIQVSGMEYAYDPEAPPYSRIMLDYVFVGGLPIELGATYTVTSNEFIPLMLDSLGIGYSNLNIFTATSEFEVVTNYVSQIDSLYPVIEGRIYAGIPPAVDDPNIPPILILEQNFPNPFNPDNPRFNRGGTTISYSLLKPCNVNLQIYNVKGQLVETLVDAYKPAGNHTTEWNVLEKSGMSSGIYFYKLSTQDNTSVKKMLLLR